MNANEILIALTEKVNFKGLYVAKPKEHGLNTLFSLGRCFPSTRAQALRFVRFGYIGGINNMDVTELIEPMLNRHGFTGVYKLTKSGRSCRLVNQFELFQAIKKEYSC